MAGEGSIVSGVAGRYATALFELALEAKQVDAVSADLTTFEALVAGNEDLKRLVKSPVFGAAEQEKAVSAVLAKAGISGLVANFIKTAAGNRRLFAVDSVTKAYRQLVSAHKGEVTAEVTVAEALSAKNQKALAEALKSTLGKEPKIDVTVDPAIMGGLVVKVGSRMVDSSLRTKLNALKSAMKEVG